MKKIVITFDAEEGKNHKLGGNIRVFSLESYNHNLENWLIKGGWFSDLDAGTVKCLVWTEEET